MTSPFRIFPSSGYLNSQYQIISSFDNVELTITLNNKVEQTLLLTKDNPTILSKLQKPGEYIASCSIAGIEHQQEIVVDDALRLGSSILKSAYVFENVDYTFLLMKDRLLLYNEKTQQTLTENRISPSEIRKIDKDNFLFITRIGEGENAFCNLGIFNLNELKITDQILDYVRDIYISDDSIIIWIEEIQSKSIKCLSTKGKLGTFLVLKEFINVQNFNLTKNNSEIYIEEKDVITLINIRNYPMSSGKKRVNNAIGSDGSIFNLNHKDIKYSDIKNYKRAEFPIPIEGFNLNPDKYFYRGGNFTKTFSKEEFEEKFEEISITEKPPEPPSPTMPYIRTELSKEQRVEHMEFFDEVYPAHNGIYHFRKISKETLLGVTFKNGRDKWVNKPYSSLNRTVTLSFKNNLENIEIFHGTSELFFEVFNSYLLLKNGLAQSLYLGSEKIKEFKSGSTLEIIIIEHKPKYLLEKVGEKYSLYDLSKPKDAVLDEVKIQNVDYFKTHNVIWYSTTGENYIKGFDLKTNNKLNFSSSLHEKFFKIDYSHFRFYNHYFFKPYTEIWIHPTTGAVKDGAIGNFVSSSPDLNKVITKRDQKIYFLVFNHSIKKYEETEIVLDNSRYLESYLSPNGNFLVLQNETEEYVLLDIEKNEEVTFLSGKFLAFSKEGNLIIEDDERRSSKIIDPLTFEKVTSATYHNYRFLSPDQKLYAQVAVKTRYYHKIKEEDIAIEEVIELRKKLDYPRQPWANSSQEDQENYEKLKGAVDKARRVYYNTYKQQLENLKINSSDDFSSQNIIDVIKYTGIGICGTDQIIEVRLPNDIEFYNYTAFSYDNKYAALVYRLPSGGGISFLQLDYNENKKTLELIDKYLSHHPKKATWVCGFSKNNFFAAYDSTGTTYFLPQKKIDLLLPKNKLTVSESEIWETIPDKNYLCFSPSGNFMGMSEEHYIPYPKDEKPFNSKTLFPLSGTYGHQESGTLHILHTETTKLVNSFYEHGDKIKYDERKKIRFVAFSDDEKRIMSMSNDGVVIVRNIDFGLLIANQN